VKSDTEIHIRGTGSPPKVNRFFRLVGSIITPTSPSFNKTGWLFLQ